jgi:aspartyl protease family protein
MRPIVQFAGILLVVAVLATRFADQATRQPAASAEPAAQPAAAVAAAQPAAMPITSGTSVSIQRDARGHFATGASVDGQHMEFMIDTGASLIAVRASDAAMLGIHPSGRGTVRAAPIQLGAVEIGGVTVRDVGALVLPNEALGENLLGMSFLSRLRRFEYENGRLVLEQ